MFLNLKDPRQFSAVYPDSNILINQAQQDLAASVTDNRLLVALISDLLKQSQDQILSVAYNLAPSQAIADYIWHSLQQALNEPEQNELTKLFAFPVVLVVGSTEQVTLANAINQVQLEELLLRKQVLVNSTPRFISGKLYDLEGIARLRPSNLFNLITDVTTVDTWNEELISAKPIINLGEGVHLRFLVGVSRFEKGQTSGLIAANYSQLGLELLQLINTDLNQANATIFPIPFPPCALSEAAVIGEYYRNEISISLRLSNLVKKLRLDGKYPELKLSSQKNNLQIEVWLSNAEQPEEILIWSLQRADNFVKISQTLAALFADMQLMVNYYPEHDHDHQD